MEVWSDRGSTCKFRNARSAFRNLHVDPLSLHTSMRNKQVEFNPYIYTLSKCSMTNSPIVQSLYLYFIKIVPFWLRNIRLLIQNTRSLFYGRHYSSLHRLMSLHGKLNVKIVLMFIVAENTGSVNIGGWNTLAERNLCHIWDFSHSFPNRSLTDMAYALKRKQHTARQNVSDFTNKHCKEFTHGFGR